MREVLLIREAREGQQSTRTIEVFAEDGRIGAEVWLDTPGWDRAAWRAPRAEVIAAIDEAAAAWRLQHPGDPVRVICPDCRGSGWRKVETVGHGTLNLACGDCAGGELTEERREWQQRGRQLAVARRQRGESTRAMAARLAIAGLGMVDVANFEQGRWDKIAPDLLEPLLAVMGAELAAVEPAAAGGGGDGN